MVIAMMMTGRRVVVTGLGLVTPLGLGVPHVWDRITAGHTGVTAVADQWVEMLPSRVAGRVPQGTRRSEFNIKKEFDLKELRNLSPATCLSLVAVKEALADANWYPRTAEERQQTGVAVGVGMLDVDDVYATGLALDHKYSKISPFFLPRVLLNMSAGNISIRYGLWGPNHCVSTACASGNHSVGDAFRMVKHGDADVMVCGGTEAPITKIAIAGFCRLRALSTSYNDAPEIASRPFDKDRDGFVMGEGAGVLVLEELSHAVRRNAKIYAEVLGYGMSGDAHHITSPREDGGGAQLAIMKCLREANIDPSQVGYVNAHATSTPMGDAIELRTIERIFGANGKSLHVSSTKGAIGHLLGAAGAVESIFTVLACHSGFIPPTVNLNNTDIDVSINLVANEAQPWLETEKKRVALNNSFGFGGTNSCLCFASYS